MIVGHDRREVPVIAVNETSFTVSKWRESAEEVFVFGTVVNDFHVVDYDRIFVLGISAIQELDRKTTELEKLKAEVEAMKADIQALKNK